MGHKKIHPGVLSRGSRLLLQRPFCCAGYVYIRKSWEVEKLYEARQNSAYSLV
jgi:hypothetical protein